jgi:hypothetical protein
MRRGAVVTRDERLHKMAEDRALAQAQGLRHAKQVLHEAASSPL